MNNDISRFTLISLLAAVVIAAVSFTSINYYWASKTEEYFTLSRMGVLYANTESTCLITAITVQQKLNINKIPARVLAFHCQKVGGEGFSHAVCLFEYDNNLFIYDFGGSSLIGSTNKYNLQSNAKLIISTTYQFVDEAEWIDKF